MWEGGTMTTTPPEYSGCLWPLDPDCAGAEEWAALDPDLQQRAHALASATLRRLTGGRVGECPITVRPCKPPHGWANGFGLPLYTGYPFTPTITETGAWVNIGCCSTASCACQITCSILLPRPVSRVDEVKVDGVVVPTDNYFVSGGDRIVWRGAEPCPFRTTQDLSKPDTEEGTLSVTYLNAFPVDSVGACSVGILALEFAKAMRGDKRCRLPGNVTAVNRQGVSMELIAGSFPNGLTGIREVDAYVALWNPGGLTSGPRVWTPDMGRTR